MTYDAIFEVYKYGYSKKSGSRKTLVALHEDHKDLNILKNELCKKYGLLANAQRWLIGDFDLEIGICDNRECVSGKTYIASSQLEWENLRTKVYNGMWQ